jgi:sodium/bile acid cotransporter 7
MLASTAFAARRFGLSREDEIAIVFCGSKKSLVTGIPMANALFTGASIGLVVLPLMIFHQLQLMASAALARRYALGGTVNAHGPSPLAAATSTTGPRP